jgi:hypothetical protein
MNALPGWIENAPMIQTCAGAYAKKRPGNRAVVFFLRATLSAELGQPDEARRDMIQGQEILKSGLAGRTTRDPGEHWLEVYTAKIRQREAEACFKTKGIHIPEVISHP